MSDATSVELAVKCRACGEPIESVPTWLIGAQVRFECDRCRQKQARAVADLEAEPRRTTRKSAPPVPAEESVVEVIEADEMDGDAEDIVLEEPDEEAAEEDAEPV